MFFSGKRIRSIPKTNTAKLVLDNALFTSITPTGYTEFGFSGSGNNSLLFKYTHSGLYAPNGKFLRGQQNGEPWDIEAYVGDSSYRLLLDGETSIGSQPKSSYKFDNLYINTVGQSLSTDIQVFTKTIDFDVVLPEQFHTQGAVVGKIQNNTSGIDFKIFDYTAEYSSHNSDVFTGVISGTVTGENTLSFLLSDISNSRRNEAIDFKLTLRTNLGEITKSLLIDRVSGYTDEHYSLIKTSEDIKVNPIFSGESGFNSFTFLSSNSAGQLFWSYYAYSGDSDEIDKDMEVYFKTIYPTGNGYYSTRYITGFELTDTGRYSTCPTIEVTGYYYVKDIDFSPNSLLFSSGCSGNIPILFTSNNGIGKGGSGLMSGERVKFYGLFDSSEYLKITDITVISGGTGYTIPPKLTPNTGIYTNCYDVPEVFGSQLTYNPFSVEAIMEPSAAYLTGEVVCSGILTGASHQYSNPYSSEYLYYIISGIKITNPGFGYDPVHYKPLMSFVRATGDVETDNASGKFTFFTGSGYYDVNSTWSIKTGFVRDELQEISEDSLNDSSLMLLEPTSFGAIYGEDTGSYILLSADASGFYGKTTVPAGNNLFVAQIGFNSLNYTGSVVAELKIIAEDGEYITNRITGTNSYSSNPYLLRSNTDLIEYEGDTGKDISFFFLKA